MTTITTHRALAEAIRDGHTPKMLQTGANGYRLRCERCHDHHPCDVYMLAVSFIDVLDAVDIAMALLMEVDQPDA